MKGFISTIALLVFTLLVYSQTQLPNAGLETWTTGQPNSWGTSDGVLVQIGQPDPGTAEQETISANVFSGTSSARLTTKNITTPLGNRDIPGVLSLGNITLNLLTFSPEVTGFPYTDRPDSIQFAAKYTSGPTGVDSGNVAITLTRWTPNGRLTIARTVTPIHDASSFIQFTKKIKYFSNQLPDTLLVQAVSTSSSTNMILESTLWVDNFSFIGIDSTFKAYINPYVSVSACEGDSVLLRTDPSNNDSYQWFNGSSLIANATLPQFNATVSGNYFVVVNHLNTSYTSDTVVVNLSPVPVVSYMLDAAQDTLCSNGPVIILTGGSPANGFFSGNAVTNNHFNPTSANSGLNLVTYTYTDSLGCSASAEQHIFVTTCTGLNETEVGQHIRVFPNPANDQLFICGINAVIFECNIFDLTGSLIIRNKIDQFTSIDVSTLPKGVYIAEIRGAEFCVKKMWSKL